MFYYLFHTSARLSWEGITRWYEDSLLKEILDYVNRQWFTVDLEAYEYIPVNENTAGNIRSLVLGFMFGFLAAALFIYLQKRSLGSFVGQLLKEDCLTPASAKTPLALGCNRSTLLRSEWKRRGAITRYVHCVEEEGASDESNQKMDFSNMHFYIPEDKRYTAEVRYERRGSKLRSLLLVMVATVALATVACIFLPVLLRWADWLIGMTAP
jgi:hypothetical protein